MGFLPLFILGLLTLVPAVVGGIIMHRTWIERRSQPRLFWLTIAGSVVFSAAMAWAISSSFS